MRSYGLYSIVLPSVSRRGHIVGHAGWIISMMGALALHNLLFTHKHKFNNSAFRSCKEMCQAQVELKLIRYQSKCMSYKYNINPTTK